ncbi:hypothetical protein BD779DRAFT_1624905 [Infundibulicybe gibba]|nr:hypothetical protein BD779DRAFT_1624905 [Infundibulicybe gibba]
MPGLLSLANELISQIGSELDTRKAFRGTCKQVDHVIAPQVLSYLVININEERIHLSISQLEALAVRSTRAAEYVQTVDIRLLAPNYNPRSPGGYVFSNGEWVLQEGPKGPEVAWAHEKMRELLLPALSTLTGTATVNWKMSDRNPAWATIAVSEFLANLPVLRTLRLKTKESGMPGLQLHRVSNLTEFVVDGYHGILPISEIIGNSPDLTHLNIQTFSYGVEAHTPTLHGLLSMVPRDRPLRLRYLGIKGCCVRLDQETLPHLSVLKSLDLRGIAHLADNRVSAEITEEVRAKAERFSSSPTEVWEALERASLPIQDITTTVSEDILGYLGSANGVEKLTLLYADSDPLAHNFFTRVLPRLSPTLTSLHISAAFEGLWCFGEHNKDALLACARLRTLSIAIDPTKLYENDDIKMIPEQTVADLLKMTAELPQRLSRLRIFSAGLEILRDAFCGNSALSHEEFSINKLSSLVESFGPVNPAIHPQTILIRRNRFHLRRCDADSSVWRYVKDKSYFNRNKFEDYL